MYVDYAQPLIRSPLSRAFMMHSSGHNAIELHTPVHLCLTWCKRTRYAVAALLSSVNWQQGSFRGAIRGAHEPFQQALSSQLSDASWTAKQYVKYKPEIKQTFSIESMERCECRAVPQQGVTACKVMQ